MATLVEDREKVADRKAHEHRGRRWTIVGTATGSTVGTGLGIAGGLLIGGTAATVAAPVVFVVGTAGAAGYWAVSALGRRSAQRAMEATNAIGGNFVEAFEDKLNADQAAIDEQLEEIEAMIGPPPWPTPGEMTGGALKKFVDDRTAYADDPARLQAADSALATQLKYFNSVRGDTLDQLQGTHGRGTDSLYGAGGGTLLLIEGAATTTGTTTYSRPGADSEKPLTSRNVAKQMQKDNARYRALTFGDLSDDDPAVERQNITDMTASLQAAYASLKVRRNQIDDAKLPLQAWKTASKGLAPGRAEHLMVMWGRNEKPSPMSDVEKKAFAALDPIAPAWKAYQADSIAATEALNGVGRADNGGAWNWQIGAVSTNPGARPRNKFGRGATFVILKYGVPLQAMIAEGISDLRRARRQALVDATAEVKRLNGEIATAETTVETAKTTLDNAAKRLEAAQEHAFYIGDDGQLHDANVDNAGDPLPEAERVRFLVDDEGNQIPYRLNDEGKPVPLRVRSDGGPGLVPVYGNNVTLAVNKDGEPQPIIEWRGGDDRPHTAPLDWNADEAFFTFVGDGSVDAPGAGSIVERVNRLQAQADKLHEAHPDLVAKRNRLQKELADLQRKQKAIDDAEAEPESGDDEELGAKVAGTKILPPPLTEEETQRLADLPDEYAAADAAVIKNYSQQSQLINAREDIVNSPLYQAAAREVTHAAFEHKQAETAHTAAKENLAGLRDTRMNTVRFAKWNVAVTKTLEFVLEKANRLLHRTVESRGATAADVDVRSVDNENPELAWRKKTSEKAAKDPGAATPKAKKPRERKPVVAGAAGESRRRPVSTGPGSGPSGGPSRRPRRPSGTP